MRVQAFFAWLSLALAGSIPIASEVAAQPPNTPDAAARQWILLVDGGDYAKSWDRASSSFRATVTAQEWQSRISPAREPLGAIMIRTTRDMTLSDTMPGLPGGKYALVHFNSTFEHKVGALETIALDMEDGRWTVIGYYIQ
jgi:hypothetical protein